MLVPTHYSSYPDSNISFNEVIDEKKWLPLLKKKKITILYYLSTGYDTSKSEGEFPVVSLCSGEIVNRCVGLRCGEERNAVNVINA